jgi:hypothetical protein
VQLILLCATVVLALVKVASTIWLLRQPDATTVTATPFGRAVYLASKISPALFIAAILARACLQGAPLGFIVFCAVFLVIAVVMAAVVMRKRAAGEWYGYAHQIRQRRRRQ